MAVWWRLGKCFAPPFVGLLCPQAFPPTKEFLKGLSGDFFFTYNYNKKNINNNNINNSNRMMMRMRSSVLLVHASPSTGELRHIHRDNNTNEGGNFPLKKVLKSLNLGIYFTYIGAQACIFFSTTII